MEALTPKSGLAGGAGEIRRGRSRAGRGGRGGAADAGRAADAGGAVAELGAGQAAQEDVDAVLRITPARRDGAVLQRGADVSGRAARGCERRSSRSWGRRWTSSRRPISTRRRSRCSSATRNRRWRAWTGYLKAAAGGRRGGRGWRRRSSFGAERPERAVEAAAGGRRRRGRMDAGAVDLLGRAYFMLGRMPEAIESFRRASDAWRRRTRSMRRTWRRRRSQFGTAPVPW